MTGRFLCGERVTRRFAQFSGPDGWLLLTVVIISLNVVVTKAALHEVQPLAFALARFGIGAFIMVIYALANGGTLRRLPGRAVIVGAAVGVFANQLLFMAALSLATASQVSLMIGTIPIFTTMAAIVAKQEVLSSRFAVALGVGFGGVALVAYHPASSSGAYIGMAAALLTAVTWGAYSVLARGLMRQTTAETLAAAMLGAGVGMLLPVALPSVLSTDFAAVTAASWATIAFSGVMAVFFVQLLYFKGVARLGAARASFYSYLQPFLGVVFAAILLHETLELWQLAGGVLVVAAMIIARSASADKRPTVLPH